MSWLPISNKDVNLSDKPRKLTVEEIQQIVNQLPLLSNEESEIIIRQLVVKRLKQILGDIDLCPSMLPEFTKQILETYLNSPDISKNSISCSKSINDFPINYSKSNI